MKLKEFLNTNKILKVILMAFSCILVFLFFIYFLLHYNILKLKGEIYNLKDNNGVLQFEMNDVKDSIKDDKTYIDFGFEDTKTIKVVADFNDTESDNKKIEFDIDEGLMYRSYPTLSLTYNDIETKITENDNLYTAIKEVEKPTVENQPYSSFDIKKSAYGKLVYYINSNVSKIEISINIKLDQLKFYENKYKDAAIKVNAYKDNEKVGEISKNVFYDSNGKLTYSTSLSSIKGYTSKVLPSASKNYYGLTYSIDNSAVYKFSNNTKLQYVPYFKSKTYKIYLPSETTFDVNDPNCIVNSYTPDDISYDETLNLVTITYNSYKPILYGIGIKYKVNNVNEYKIYEAKEKSSVYYELYDRTKKEDIVDKKFNVEIVDPSLVSSKLKIDAYDAYEDKDAETFVYGPIFRLRNEDPIDIEDTVLEYKIDSNYEAVKVTFPKPLNSTIYDVYYKTNKNNNWIKYEKIDNNTKLFSISKNIVGLENDEYFTQVKATISNFESGYQSSIAAPKRNDNATVYGNLKSDAKKALVEFYSYSKNEDYASCYENTDGDKCKTWNHLTGKVIYTNDNIAAPISGDTYFKIDKKTVSSGDSFTISGILNAFIHYPYGTRLYIDNTKIYLRQPKGLTINLSSINLKNEKNEPIDIQSKNIEKKINFNGDTIYVINTNYKVGGYFTNNLDVKSLNLEVKYKVNNDCDISSISINELLSWGSDNYKESPINTITDKFDLNLNGKTNDKIYNTSNQSISILKTKSVIISTSIIKNNEISLPYDPENKDTILSLYSKDEFNYHVSIKNNTDGQINDYVLYLPIPKTGYDFGPKFQSKPFTWNMKLVKKPTLPSGYKILYAINNTRSNTVSYSDLTYVSNIDEDDLKNVVMIKIISTKKLVEGDSEKLNIVLSSSESRISSIKKLGSLNIWNPISILNTTSISGEFKGNMVATKLLFPELSGRIFIDNNLNGIYDEGIDKISSVSKIELYKLNSDNSYELVSINNIMVDKDTGYYYINDSKYLNKGIYALKFTVNEGYNILENNVINKEGWIKNIEVNEIPINNLDVPLLKYDLDFDIIKEEIVAKDESILVSINNITPNYFDIIKDYAKAYSWKVNENYTDYVEIEDNNDSKTVLKGLKEVNKALIDVTISDKYGKKLTKNFYVTVKEDTKPVIEAEDISLFVNDRFEYEKYIKEAYDYKNNKIVLDFGINGNATYQTDAIIEDDLLKKEGTYKVRYVVSDKYGNTGYKEINLYVKRKDINDVINDSINKLINPKTYDNIFTYVYILVGSMIAILLVIFKFIKQKEQN